jgi:hypothetical protein
VHRNHRWFPWLITYHNDTRHTTKNGSIDYGSTMTRLIVAERPAKACSCVSSTFRAERMRSIMYVDYKKKLFLLMVQPKYQTNYPIKLCVRRVVLRQFGHFMMGNARIYGHVVTVSGAYGSDGLPMNVPKEVYDKLSVILPDELYAMWNKGGGWNSCGSEASAMRKWALGCLASLRK